MEIIAVIEVQKGRNEEMRTQITQLHNQSISSWNTHIHIPNSNLGFLL